MKNQPAYKETINSFQIRLAVIIGIAIAFVAGIGIVLSQQMKKRQSLPVTPQASQLKQNEFNGLWESLQKKTVPVEITGEIQYGGDVGKAEPFE